ncbi:MAG: hypothetical protein KatS3mg090_0197 [Patescibacteria group bacterium]|nr:MAG: hypothetical protein KatS3mg090_0197 [Patescibacteria group bacterium]
MKTLRQDLADIYLHKLRELFPEVKPSLNYKTDFQFLTAVMLSAQSTDKQVNKITKDFFNKFPTAESIAKASLSEIKQQLKSLGLYNTKSINLKKTAEIIYKKHNGKVPKDRQLLEALPGVGRKTANVVLSTLYNDNSGIAVDTHIARLARLLALTNHTSRLKIEQDLLKLIPENQRFGFSLRLIFYGRKYCKANHFAMHNPNHYHCPLTVELRIYLQKKRIALIGFSFNKDKYGNKIAKDLIRFGFNNLFLVNPKGGRYGNRLVYKDIKDILINSEIDIFLFVVKPEISLRIVRCLNQKKVSGHYWFQPGSLADDLVGYLNGNNLSFSSFCIMRSAGIW